MKKRGNFLRRAKRVFKLRSADGSFAVSDEERVKLIEKAFQDCGVEPKREQVAKQFLYETGRKLGEPTRRYRSGSKARMW